VRLTIRVLFDAKIVSLWFFFIGINGGNELGYLESYMMVGMNEWELAAKKSKRVVSFGCRVV
jgi:hypothetical protein